MEATVAVNFILSYLYNKLPRRRVDMFGEMLEQLLQINLEKFWISQMSKSDQSFNVSFSYTFYLGIGTNQVDSLINQVAAACLIDIYEILSYFPENLTVFIEPGKLQYSINPADSNFDIWRSDQRKYEMLEMLKEGLLQSPGYDQKPQIQEQELITSTEKMSLSTTGTLPYSNTFGWQTSSTGPQIVQVSSEGCFIQKSSSTPNFTAASFAQTKFGSTKLKSQLKRSSRISTYLAQQRSLAGVIPITTTLEPSKKSPIVTTSGSPSSLSPFTSSYFESPTSMLTQRSISLSPCVRPQRGHSPPFSFNMPLILPPFTSGTDIIGAPQIPIASSTQLLPPTIQITREDTTPVTFAVTTIDELFSWPKNNN